MLKRNIASFRHAGAIHPLRASPDNGNVLETLRRDQPDLGALSLQEAVKRDGG